MKRLMAVLAAIMVVLPITAKADTYATYTKGQEVNFYTHDDDEIGRSSVILDDKGSADQFVKTWMFGVLGTGPDVYADTKIGEAATPFESTGAYKTLKSHVNNLVQGYAGHAKDIETAGNLQLITLEELIDVFGATANGETYTIDVATWGEQFARVATSAKGIFTQTVDGENVWALDIIKDQVTGDVTELTVKKVPCGTTTANDYALIPVVYMDKTYDCAERNTKANYACYQCGEDYTWSEIGTQADTCKLLDSITAKSKCVKSPKTGVEEYLLEFVAVAGVCGVALVIAKRKDLFRSI